MKIMYIAPRYHTNQTAIMKGFVENGHEVSFLSHYRGNIEDYTYVEPVIVGYSPVYRFLDKIYVEYLHKGDKLAADKKLKCGFPSFAKLYTHMRRFTPDVVILRERSVYSICAYLICRLLHYPSILYNQSPLWEKEIKNDLAHRIVRKLSPEYRITPVYGNEKINRAKEEKACFVPFVMEPKLSPEEKEYGKRKRIRIFSIGKYEERKNQIMLIGAMKELSANYKIELIIAGECSTQYHRQYYEQMVEFVKESKMEDWVTALMNLNKEQIEEEYKKADVFVIPSTREPASISQLEAMAFSLPVICSDTNGTACYVENGKNGYCFKDNDILDLQDKIENIISNKDMMRQMGCESYRLIKERYGFTRYYNSICRIMQEIQ